MKSNKQLFSQRGSLLILDSYQPINQNITISNCPLPYLNINRSKSNHLESLFKDIDTELFYNPSPQKLKRNAKKSKTKNHSLQKKYANYYESLANLNNKSYEQEQNCEDEISYKQLNLENLNNYDHFKPKKSLNLIEQNQRGQTQRFQPVQNDTRQLINEVSIRKSIKEIKQLTSKVRYLESENNQFLAKLKAYQTQNVQNKVSETSSKSQIQQYRKEIQNLKAKIKIDRQMYSLNNQTASSQIKQLKQINKTLQNDLKQVKIKLQQSKKQILQLKKQRKNHQKNRQQQTKTQSLYKQQIKNLKANLNKYDQQASRSVHNKLIKNYHKKLFQNIILLNQINRLNISEKQYNIKIQHFEQYIKTIKTKNDLQGHLEIYKLKSQIKSKNQMNENLKQQVQRLQKQCKRNQDLKNHRDQIVSKSFDGILCVSADSNILRNPLYDCYSINKNHIIKTSLAEKWQIFRFEQILPLTGKYTISFRIVKSKLNCIEVGIMPQNKHPVEDKICQKSLGYHIANGKIHDTNGQIDKNTSSWRTVTEMKKEICNQTIELSIHADKRMIRWKVQGKSIAQSVITNYLMQKRFVAYFSMIHSGDQIQINVPKYKHQDNKKI